MSDNAEKTRPPAIQELTGRIGKYEIIRKLGKGAMGVVYLAHDTMLDRDVALKIMAAQIVDDSELKARFEREARAVAKMTHPNVVTVFDLGSYEGAPFIAMELLKGQDLSQVMRHGAPLSLDRKVAIIAQVLAGLGQAHQAGIIHRDVKPANVFITLEGMVKIMDFGVAHITTASMTGAGNIVGTAEYMSPEQVQGAKVDGRSDLFAVGCMLFEFVTGRRPFHADNLMAVFFKITHDEPDFELMPKDPTHQALIPILRKALAKRLEHRFQTAHDFISELRSFLRNHTTSDSAQHLIEQLIATAPPPGAYPSPLMDGRGSALPQDTDATVLASERASISVPTRRPVAGPTPMAKASRMQPSRTATPRHPYVPSRTLSRRHGSVWVTLSVVALGAGTAAFLLSKRFTPRQAADTTVSSPTPPSSVAVMDTRAESIPRSPESTPGPVTPAPPPTFAGTEERSAAMNAAQAAFREGDYGMALSRAQEELRLSPSNDQARRLVDSALAGKKAQAHFRSARTALSSGDFARALSEAEAGRVLAPWDTHGPQLIQEIRSTQRRAKAERRGSERQERISRILDQADAALLAEDYDRAIDLYDEVLKLSPGNARAGQGKTGAISARALADAAAKAPASTAKRFVSGKTVTQTAESRRAGSMPNGFEPSDEVVVHRSAVALELPGAVLFEVRPETVSPGERYTVKAFLLNRGNASIQLLDMLVTTKINGQKSGGTVPPQAREVGPKQRALLLSQSDVWRAEYSTWSMEITVRSIRGDIFRNSVSWK